MPALFVFLLKVNLALLLFYAGYYLVLRPLTFYTLNRAYLVSAILFATVYPYIDLTAFAQRHENLAKPVQVVMYKWQLPAEELLSKPDYWQWATVLFWVGVVVLGIRFAMQLFSLHMLYRNSKPQRIHNHNVRVMEGEAAPFSFWRSIYINPANHAQADLEAILQHEQIHVNGWHTLDILLAELSCIFYWFNPGIWLMKKAVRENIEFITDRRILNNGIDSKSYQYSLVNVSFNNHTPGIVNHFNLSTIKKRIIMMNAKRSSKANLTRYAFVIPVVVCSLLVFTISKAEVAKPFTIKFANAIKPVTIAIKQAAKEAGISFIDTVPAKKTAIFITKRDTGKRANVHVFATKSDTAKKATFSITFDKKNSLDSSTIFINDKKASKEDLAKLNPSKIAGLKVLTDNDAKRFADDHGVKVEDKIILVVTKDTEEGKQLMKVSVVENPITKITINGIAKDPNNLTDKEKVVIASLPRAENLNGKISQIVVTRRADAPKQQGSIDEVVVDGKRLENINIRIDSSATVKGYQTNKDVIIRADKPATFGLQGSVGANEVARVYTIRRNNLDKISDKVIVIDGKVASEKEMKKLSAYDIDRIALGSELTVASPDSVKKYGEKAKNGVVYITTKKEKN